MLSTKSLISSRSRSWLLKVLLLGLEGAATVTFRDMMLFVTSSEGERDTAGKDETAQSKDRW